MNTTVPNTSETFANTLVKAWTTQVSRINDVLAAIPDEDMLKEIAPGKNTGIYVLGHLAAVHDAMLPLLGFGQRLYPHLEEPFIKSADGSGHQFPSVAELRSAWNEVNSVLDRHITNLDADEWLTRHNAVSPEDFAKEPHRNKLAVLISRTTHMSYHHGQLVWLKKKK